LQLIKALELFCGIGGFAAAAAGSNIRVAGAIDQSLIALGVYRLNFPGHRLCSINLKGATVKMLAAYGADFWWLSPPCQPYCIQGRKKDLDDPRAGSFIRILKILSALPVKDLPNDLALENVPGFGASAARAQLIDLLTQRGYEARERLLCPTQLGLPMRRLRYYLTASRQGINPVPLPGLRPMECLADFLDSGKNGEFPENLLLDEETVARFGSGLHILDAGDPAACAACFTSGYGRFRMHTGSYLRCGEGVRRLSPIEIARLLHLPDGFRFPEGMSLQKQWQLVGNSLSVPAVREVLKAFPGVQWPEKKDAGNLGKKGKS
jgi:site-specific DNA-cytosine methylase